MELVDDIKQLIKVDIGGRTEALIVELAVISEKSLKARVGF